MGHVDHGKSTLLDYIRSTNTVDGEAGGITQHIAAYEASYKDGNEEKKITFIDTPGHAAFSDMRHRGARIADIAVLIVSAEDGVKAQTIEAIETIKANKVPYVVAINKIDKPNANPERVKTELMEHGVFLEGFGGDIPYGELSAKAGTGVDDFLGTILLVAELEEFLGDTTKLATGFVVESHLDEKRGVSATMIIKDGVVEQGNYIVVNDCIASTRILEDYTGKSITDAQFSSPIIVTGFGKVPEVGSTFTTYATKKEAEAAAEEYKVVAEELSDPKTLVNLKEGQVLVPIILKTDVVGTQAAIKQEIEKIKHEDVIFKIIKMGVGAINESDVQIALGDSNTIILGFNVPVEKKATTMNDAETVTIKTFDIIYKMIEWLEEEQEQRRPRKEVEKITGTLKVLKHFSTTKDKHVFGGKVTEGVLKLEDKVKITRGGEIVTRGIIKNLQAGKSDVQKIEAGNECGMMIIADATPQPGDTLEAFIIEVK